MTKHMLITGATSGIGAGIARAAAQTGMGLTITGLEAETELADFLASIKEEGAAFVSYHQVDLSEGAQARALIDEAQKRAGDIHILVNNAGIQHVDAVDAFPPAAWDKVLAVNLSAAFHTSAAILPAMRQGGFGRIINIASVHGLVASVHKAAYVAAKHGLIGLTKTIALETARQPITCNAICPGWVRTPLVEAQLEARAKAAGRDIEEEAALLVGEKQPSAAFVTPAQIGEMVLYLASENAEMITGSSFTMDGGWTAQ